MGNSKTREEKNCWKQEMFSDAYDDMIWSTVCQVESTVELRRIAVSTFMFVNILYKLDLDREQSGYAELFT